MEIDFTKKFTRLVLSGGGSRCLAVLGALHFLHENGHLDDIEEYWGTSSGSLVALLLLIGYTPFEAFHRLFMLEDLADPEKLDMQTLLENTALCPIEHFGDRVRLLIREKLVGQDDVTFKDIYKKYGKKIHIIGANTRTKSGVCFDVDSEPDMKVIDAIEISCDLPFFFTKKVYKGDVYVDGGFINNYPINLADNDKDQVLGICVFGDFKFSNSKYIEWIYGLLFMPIMELHRDRVSRLSSKCLNIELQSDIGLMEMAPTQKQKIDTFSGGYQQTRDKYIQLVKEWELRTDWFKSLTDQKAEPGDGWDVDFEPF